MDICTERIVAVGEIIVAVFVVSKRGIVAYGANSIGAPLFQRPTMRAPTDPCPCRAAPPAGDKPAEFRHLLLKAAEYHVRAILDPWRCHFGAGPGLTALSVLAGIAEDELARPHQILARQTL